MDPNESLHEQLDAVAASIDVGDPVGRLASVHGVVKQRRRRRQVGAAVCASALLVAGGVVGVGVLSDRGGSDTLSIQAPPDTEGPPVTEAAAQEASTADAAPAGTTPSAGTAQAAGPGGATTVDIIDVAVSSASAPGTGDPLEDGYVDWLVPWQDGFLAGRTTYPPQLLPETLPDEIIALFPPEVVEFFNGALPPTIGEATEMLSEAGLLDEVSAVLAEHPEAYDAIYSEQVEPVSEVFFSVDGAEWAPREFVAPDGVGYPQSVQTVDDRLVFMAQAEVDQQTQLTGPFSEPDRSGPILVASTSDLTSWDLVEVPLAGRPADLPDVLAYAVYPQTFAANANGWVVGVSESFNVRVDRVLPADLLAELSSGSSGYGYGFSESGLQISIDSGVVTDVPNADGDIVRAEPAPSAEYDYTWEELGISPDIAEHVTGAVANGLQVWAAPWGGAPMPADVAGAYSIVASSDGFYATGESLSFSADGVSWASLRPPDKNPWRVSVMPIERGVIVVAGNGEVSDVYRVDGALDTWELLDIPGRPENLGNTYFSDSATSPILVVDAAPQPVPPPSTIEVESDGFVLTVAQDWPTVTITLVGPDGAVLIDQTSDPSVAEQDQQPQQVIQWSPEGVDILDPVTGDTILTIDIAVFEAAYAADLNASSVDDEVRETDLWMLATVDGDRWLVVDLDDSAGGVDGPSASSLNDAALLFNFAGQWMTYDLS